MFVWLDRERSGTRRLPKTGPTKTNTGMLAQPGLNRLTHTHTHRKTDARVQAGLAEVEVKRETHEQPGSSDRRMEGETVGKDGDRGSRRHHCPLPPLSKACGCCDGTRSRQTDARARRSSQHIPGNARRVLAGAACQHANRAIACFRRKRSQQHLEALSHLVCPHFSSP